MEIGLYTFAEVALDPETGSPLGTEQRMRELIEEIELADQVGLDVFGLGDLAASGVWLGITRGCHAVDRAARDGRGARGV